MSESISLALYSTQLPFVVTIIVLIYLSIISGKKVKSEADFAVAGRSLDRWGVASAIIGTLVGGASTIGTVEMAYKSGFASFYFTLGSGIACAILGFFFASLLREAETVTISQFLGKYFGSKFQIYTSFFTAVGMYVHIIAQYLAATAILTSVFKCSIYLALVITFICLVLLVIVGGMVGSSWIGKAKLFFLYIIMGLSAGIALDKFNGFSNFVKYCQTTQENIGLFSYGYYLGLKEIVSVVIGVLATQTYLQAIFSAKDVKEAKWGAIISALLIPPIGLFGIIVGLYLKYSNFHLQTTTATAFPVFLENNFSSTLASVFMAGLFYIVLGTGAGLALGVTTNISVDLLEKIKFFNKFISPLARIRIVGMLVLASSAIIVVLKLSTAILKWSYLSMGLRGSTILPALLLTMLAKEKRFSYKTTLVLAALPILYIISVIITFQ